MGQILVTSISLGLVLVFCWAIICVVFGSEKGVFFVGFDLKIFRMIETLAVDISGLKQF